MHPLQKLPASLFLEMMTELTVATVPIFHAASPTLSPLPPLPEESDSVDPLSSQGVAHCIEPRFVLLWIFLVWHAATCLLFQQAYNELDLVLLQKVPTQNHKYPESYL
jgi:hypothetical protein